MLKEKHNKLKQCKKVYALVGSVVNMWKYKLHGITANLDAVEEEMQPMLIRRIAQMVDKEPRTTSKEIQAELQGRARKLLEH